MVKPESELYYTWPELLFGIGLSRRVKGEKCVEWSDFFIGFGLLLFFGTHILAAIAWAGTEYQFIYPDWLRVCFFTGSGGVIFGLLLRFASWVF